MENEEDKERSDEGRRCKKILKNESVYIYDSCRLPYQRTRKRVGGAKEKREIKVKK